MTTKHLHQEPTLAVIKISIMIIILTSLLSGCSTSKPQMELTIADIASEKEMTEGNTIYIIENGEYIPYYVLVKNYNNSNCVLLLRKLLLEEKISFNTIEIPTSQYENSVVDMFLENDFVQAFDDDFREQIPTVNISTIKSAYVGKANAKTTQIKRKIFLLSYTELGMKEEPLEAVEGEKIAVFKDADARIAYGLDGEAESWWTRTSHNWGGDLAVGIGADGTVGNGVTSSLNGVRPAFCLPSNLIITTNQDIFAWQTVYILE